MSRVYLDNNSTTPIDPEVAEAVRAVQNDLLGNPASQHWAGRQARSLLEDAREAVGEILDAEAGDQVVFTSGGTEANNLALRGLGCTDDAGTHCAEIVVSAVEHPSVLETAAALVSEGGTVRRLPVDCHGVVSPNAVAKALSPQTRLVSVMLANNETGVLQPLSEIGVVCRKAGVLFHSDAVQAIGKIPVSFRNLGLDAMSVAAHKFHGPVGIGALVVRSGVKIGPLLRGGFQQLGSRPGTEPVALAVGMARALILWRQAGSARTAKLAALRDGLEQRLLAGDSSLVVHGAGAERVPQTSCISFPGVDRQALMMALDLAGIACSTGSACASGSSEPSHVLIEMGVAEGLISSAVRFSVSDRLSPAEVAPAAQRIRLVYRDLRSQPESQKSPSPARQ